MVKSTMAQLFHRTITQARGKLEEGRETSLLILDSSVSVISFFFLQWEDTMCFLHNYIIGFNNNNNNKELKGEKRPQNTDLGVTNTHRSQLKPRNLLLLSLLGGKVKKSKGTEGRKRRPQGWHHGHLDKHESTHTSEWVRGKTNRKERFLSKHLSTLAASVTNASPLWGKTLPSLSGSEE